MLSMILQPDIVPIRRIVRLQSTLEIILTSLASSLQGRRDRRNIVNHVAREPKFVADRLVLMAAYIFN